MYVSCVLRKSFLTAVRVVQVDQEAGQVEDAAEEVRPADDWRDGLDVHGVADVEQSRQNTRPLTAKEGPARRAKERRETSSQ